MNALIWVIYIVLIAVSIGLIVFVLMQESKSGGMGAAFGGSNESFFGRNRSKTKESQLALATKIGAVIIAVLAIVLVILLRI